MLQPKYRTAPHRWHMDNQPGWGGAAMKPAVIIPEMRDILAVVEHINREGKNPDEITIFKELHESNQHRGREIEIVGIFVLTRLLKKAGRYSGVCRYDQTPAPARNI